MSEKCRYNNNNNKQNNNNSDNPLTSRPTDGGKIKFPYFSSYSMDFYGLTSLTLAAADQFSNCPTLSKVV